MGGGLSTAVHRELHFGIKATLRSAIDIILEALTSMECLE